MPMKLGSVNSVFAVYSGFIIRPFLHVERSFVMRIWGGGGKPFSGVCGFDRRLYNCCTPADLGS